MSARREALLWAAQRASAALLALCVVVHLATMIYAVHSGLSAAQILERTRGNAVWLGFYSVFLLAVVLLKESQIKQQLREAGEQAARGLVGGEVQVQRVRRQGGGQGAAAGGVAAYAHEGCLRYTVFVGPIVCWGYWLGYSLVQAVIALIFG